MDNVRGVSPIFALGVCAPLVACGPGTIPSFYSDNPASRNAAIVDAAAAADDASIPNLVRMLDSEEPSTRFLAIQTLERLTGETFGYDYGWNESERREAVSRWRSFAAERDSGG